MANEALQYLRALIEEDIEAAERFEDAMDGKSWQEAGGQAIDAAFQISAKRRFEGKPLSEIVMWVADLRSELGEDANDIDQNQAESLIRAVVRGERDGISDLDPESTAQLEIVITAKLGMEADLAGAELEAFLKEAETLASTWKSDV